MNPNDPMNGQLPQPNPQPIVPQQNPVGDYGVLPPQTPATHGGHNPYEFIMTSNDKPKTSFFKGSLNSASRLLLIVFGVGVIVVILGIVVTAFQSKNASVSSLTAIAQEQQEIMRVAAQGEHQAASETTKGLAYTIDLSVGTSQTQLLSYLTTRNTKLNVKQLSLKKDASTDTMLAAAQASSTYDSALKKNLAEQLKTYLSDVQQAYKNTTATKLKQVLDSSYTSGKILLDEATAIQD
jgi:hypothetical protein